METRSLFVVLYAYTFVRPKNTHTFARILRGIPTPFFTPFFAHLKLILFFTIDEYLQIGHLLLTHLLDWTTSKKDPYKSWFSSVLMTHLIHQNPDSHVFLGKLLWNESQDPENGVPFLHKVLYTLIGAVREGGDVRVLIGLFCFVNVWLYEDEEGVQEFLNEGSNLQFVSDFFFRINLKEKPSGSHEKILIEFLVIASI